MKEKIFKSYGACWSATWLWSSGYNAGHYGSFGEEMIYAALGGFAVAILNTEI